MAEHDPFMVGVVIACHAPSSVWGEAIWVPEQVLEGAPLTPPWTILSATKDKTIYFAGSYPVQLYPASTGYYRDNLMGERPKLWVVMRPHAAQPPVEIVLVTADPTEGEGATETGTNVVGVVDMPASVAGEIAKFVESHHVERVFEKRTRDKSKPRERRGGGGPR